jgi:O-antigen/teichoic acid export membrane protein
MSDQAETSLDRRYLAKLIANIIGLFINMVVQTIIPRGLGPKLYGDFNFLSNFFLQLMPFFSLNTSNKFYTKLSQRQTEFRLVSFYLLFTGLSFLLLIIFTYLSQSVGFADVIWPDQDVANIYMGAVWCIFAWGATLVALMSDAYGLTVKTEIARIFQRCFGLLILLALFWLNQLNLFTFFFYHYFVLSLLIFLFIWIMTHEIKSSFHDWYLSRKHIKAYIKEFYEFSHPLFIYAFIGALVGILDRWLLQKFGGSVQQGFFGLSYQIGSVCFLFSSAMSLLIMREFSIAFDRNDLKEMARLFRRYVPTLYSLAAYLGCFVCVQAEKITYIFAGSQFTDAGLPVMIMALYPIHQTYGQLSGSVFLATGQTKLYRNIGVSFMILSVPISYSLLAPSAQMGFDAGAIGLALKFVLAQFIAVNIQLFYNTRFLKLRFIDYFSHQIICIGSLLIMALLSRSVAGMFSFSQYNIVIEFLLSGFFYTVLVIGAVYFYPKIFGLRRGDAVFLLSKARDLIYNKS